MVLGNGVHDMRWDEMIWDEMPLSTGPACLPACLWKGDATILSDRSSDRQRRWCCPPLRWKGREGKGREGWGRQAGRMILSARIYLRNSPSPWWWWHNTGENSDTTSDLPCPVILLRQPNVSSLIDFLFPPFHVVHWCARSSCGEYSIVRIRWVLLFILFLVRIVRGWMSWFDESHCCGHEHTA